VNYLKKNIFFLFTKLQLFFNFDFSFTVHNYSLLELIFSDAKTDCQAKGRLSDKQTSA